DLLTELPQVHLRALVGAVLAPHHRVHRELTARRAPTQDLADLLVLLRREPERRVRLLPLGGRGGVLDGVDDVRRGGAHGGLLLGREGRVATSTSYRRPHPPPGVRRASTAASRRQFRPIRLPFSGRIRRLGGAPELRGALRRRNRMREPGSMDTGTIIELVTVRTWPAFALAVAIVAAASALAALIL